MKRVRYIGLLLMLLLVGVGSVYAQKTLSGQVVEILNGQKEPVMGANVVVKNKTNRYLVGAITDMDGNYRLTVPNESDLVISFSYIGLATKNVPYTGQSTLNVTLQVDAEQLQEVEITARKIERDGMGVSFLEQTSATQKVSMTELVENAPVTSVEEALQGQLAGVDITLGGDPGARSAIRIRGVNSLNASSEPLIVIDGVPYPTDISDDFDFATANEEDFGALLNISPSDIETIEVLKDAAATAIYGTQGANGVLLINTKKGVKGKTTFTFSSKFTAKYEPASMPLLNGDQYTSLIQDALWNTANANGLVGSADALSYLFGEKGLELIRDKNWEYYDEYNVNTDWYDLVRQDATSFDNNFSMSGGGDKATYRFSLGYLDETGTTIGTGLDRLTAKLNIGYAFSDRLLVTTDFAFTQTNKDANAVDDVRSEALRKMPNKSPYMIDDETGLPTSSYFSRQNDDIQGAYKDGKNFNPVAMVNEGFNKTRSREEKFTLRVKYKFPFNLTYEGYVSMNLKTNKNRKFLPQVATGVLWTNSTANSSTDAMSDNLTLQTENKLLFNKTFAEKHDLIATYLFYTQQSQNSSYTSVTGGNASGDMSDPVAGGVVSSLKSGRSESRRIRSIIQAVYTYDRRYVFKASLGTEGSSAMGKSERFANFPSFGVSWNINEEPFMEKVDWLTDTKLRFSLGWSGTPPSGSALYLGAYKSLGSYGDMAAIYPVRMQLDNLKWETSREWNIGFDVRLFERFTATFDYYDKYTKDLLQQDFGIPSTVGYTQIKWYNSGELSNRGIEFRFDYEVLKNKDWRVNVGLNMARNINRVEKLPSNMNIDNYKADNGEYAQRVVAGDPIGSFYGYRYKGVYQNVEDTYARDAKGNIMRDFNGNVITMKNLSDQCFPGDAKYEDINHDGVINSSDIVYLGNSIPLFTGGANLSVRYKDFSITANFHGRFGQKVINQARIDTENMFSFSNQSTAVLSRWRKEGDQTSIPRALWNDGYNYLGSDRFVEDASYLRLKSISFSWNMPKKWLKHVNIDRLQLYCTGYDLLTFTDYSGQDPEVSLPSKALSLVKDSSRTPVSKRITFGLNMSF